jgi:hypothetical protein
MLVGSATHCLYEWREPSDATADIDLHEDAGDERLSEFERKRRRSRRGGRRQLRRKLREAEDLAARIAGSQPRTVITVPAELVADFRAGLFNELSVRSGEIADLVVRADRERHRKTYETHLACLEQVIDLIDLVGWSAPKQQTAVAVDVGHCRHAARAALDFAIRDAELELERSDPQAPNRDAIAMRLRPLRNLAKAAAECALSSETSGPPA